MATNRVELVDSGHPQAGEPKFETVEEASEFLKEAALVSANAAHFKALWSQINKKGGKDSASQDKRKMLKELSARLASGKLRLREQRALAGQVMSASEAGGGFSEPRPSWSPSAQIKIRERPEPAPPPPPEPPTNVEQQVRALLQAARSGAPFCERCQENQPPSDE